MRHPGSELAGGLLILAALGAASAAWAVPTPEEVDRVAATATQLQEQGRWPEALASLERGLTACGAGQDGRACRVALRVRAAYLAERQSRRERDGEALERRAAAFYEDAIREDAGHGAAITHLARLYQGLGETARGVDVLRRGLNANAEMTSTLAVTLGDMLRDEKKAGEALDAYRRALRADPDDATAARRIVDLYRDLLPDRLTELAKLLADWRPTPALHEAVEHGHRAIIERTYATAPPLALESLVAWTELSARRRWISAASVATLPAGWTHAAVADLRGYVAAPERVAANNWWMRAAPTRNTLAGVALALGHERLRQGDPPGAEARWRAGVDIAPGYDEYMFRSELKDRWVVRADLQSQLASLYTAYPALDPRRSRFTALVHDLYGGKAQAYTLGDREAIQRYHTVLGLLFAERREWTSSPSYMSAIFQLSHAIKMAQDREKERGPQPLPELKALLAQGYADTGQPKEARATYVRAAEAYLETDDLARAVEMIDGAKRMPAPVLPAEAGLAAILKSRASIARASAASLAAEHGGIRTSVDDAWIFGANLAGVSAEFVTRQRFKALADLSARAREVGEPTAAARYATEAFDRGAKDVKSLIDFGDLVRIRTVRKLMVDPTPREPKAGAAAPEKTWLLSVAGEGSARQVTIESAVGVKVRSRY